MASFIQINQTHIATQESRLMSERCQ